MRIKTTVTKPVNNTANPSGSKERIIIIFIGSELLQISIGMAKGIE